MAHRTCSIPECDRPHRARGWCATHWERWRNGLPLDYRRSSQSERPCIVQQCGAARYVKQMCVKHYYRWLRRGTTEAGRAWRSDVRERVERRGRWAAHRDLGDQECELVEYGFCSPRIIVHHVNEDPSDNRPENLRVLCNRHHTLHHKGDFDLDNPDHTGYYVTAKGTLRRRLRKFRHGVHPGEQE